MYFSRVRIRPDIYKSCQLGRVIEGNVYGMHRLLWDLFPGEQERAFLYREEVAREQLGALPSVRGEPIYYLVSHVKPVEPEASLFTVETKGYRPQLKVGQCLGFECRLNPVVTRQGKKHDVAMDAQLQFLASLTKECRLESLSLAKKSDYKKQLLAQDGDFLNQRLTEVLADDPCYAERLGKISSLSDKLEWSIKAHIDAALGDWLKRQGERFGFALAVDDNGLTKLQNSAYTWHSLLDKTRKKDNKSGFSSVDFSGELQITDIEKFEKALFQGIGRSKAFGCGLLMVRRV